MPPVSDGDDEGESRRQVARRAQRQAGERSARLAHTLMKLPASALGKLGLDEDLREVADRARAVTAHVARRRAERGLAGELRRVDLVELEARLARVQTTGAAEPQTFHLAEKWRALMIEGGVAAVADFPGGAKDPLPRLIEEAQRERATGRPPGAARALFRHVAAVLNAQRADPAPPVGDDAAAAAADDDGDDDDDGDGDDDA
jgi:ribosome-associated protein